jgi:hypothetical protein
MDGRAELLGVDEGWLLGRELGFVDGPQDGQSLTDGCNDGPVEGTLLEEGWLLGSLLGDGTITTTTGSSNAPPSTPAFCRLVHASPQLAAFCCRLDVKPPSDTASSM